MNNSPNKSFFSKRLDLILSRLERGRRKVLQGKDPEALHDFRVTLRRLRTCLRLLESCYPPRTFLPVNTLLKEITQTTNSLRDLEVSGALWKSLPPLPPSSSGLKGWLRTQGEIKQLREAEVRAELASPLLIRALLGFEKKLALRGEGRKIATVAAEAFGVERGKLKGILQKTKHPKTGSAHLHKLRVQSKRVRYCLEEFPFLLPGGARPLAALCKRTQNALGDWRDLDQALRLLEKAGNGLYPETRPWIKELKNRRNISWKESQKAVQNLHGALDQYNL
jgi:CHAD domain-containing protein